MKKYAIVMMIIVLLLYIGKSTIVGAATHEHTDACYPEGVTTHYHSDNKCLTGDCGRYEFLHATGTGGQDGPTSGWSAKQYIFQCSGCGKQQTIPIAKTNSTTSSNYKTETYYLPNGTTVSFTAYGIEDSTVGSNDMTYKDFYDDIWTKFTEEDWSPGACGDNVTLTCGKTEGISYDIDGNEVKLICFLKIDNIQPKKSNQTVIK